MSLTDGELDAAEIRLTEAIAQLQAQHRPNDWRGIFALHSFWSHIKQISPFNILENKRALLANGSGWPVDIAGPSQFLIDSLSKGLNPRETVQAFANEVEKNAVVIWEVTALLGAKVDTICDLGNECWLYPSGMLPDDHHRRYIFASKWPPQVPHEIDMAAIVQKIERSPYLVDKDDAEAIKAHGKKTSSEVDDRSTFRNRIRSSVLLSSAQAVELGWTYTTTEKASIYSSSSMTGGPNVNDDHLFPTPFDFEACKSTLLALAKMPASKSLAVPIDRLGRSRMNRSREDSAIDLGVSMEALLMHGDSKANQEIGFKLGLRAGWLLGANVEDRIAVKKRVGNLYAARSRAAHGGKLMPNDFDQEDADALVRTLINVVLERGEIPDWIRLTFGG